MSKLAKALTAAAGNAGESLYVEDVFSTYLYEGTQALQTIDNGIDLAGEGGLVWIKSRNNAGATSSHVLLDTERGADTTTSQLSSDSTSAAATGYLDSYNSDGFTLKATGGAKYNYIGADYASWTFRKAEKFFDVVTYTGNGTTQEISHNLGSTPACIIVKNTQSSTFWAVYHGSIPAFVGFLNATNAFDTSNTQNFGDNTSPVAPTDSVFTVGQQSLVNSDGETYVAYLFASDAGGFGGDENIIKCGSYTGNATLGNSVSLGFEPQFVLVKSSTYASGDPWFICDMMRGSLSYTDGPYLQADSSTTETSLIKLSATADGFIVNTTFDPNRSGETYIYIAIRRPMKTPESGTEVYTAVSASTSPYPTTVTSGFPVDMVIMGDQPTTWGYNWSV